MCGGVVLPAREHGRDMQPYLSSFPFVEDGGFEEVQNTKRGLGYAVHPGQADGSMLVLAKEWGIGRKAVSRLLEDFSERGLIRVDSTPVTSIIDMVCVKSWMIAGRLIENPAYRQTVKTYEGVRIFLFNEQKLETLRRSSARKKKEKPTEETAKGTDGLPSMNPTRSNPIIEGTGTSETETAATTESEVESTAENAVVDADNTPVLEDGNTPVRLTEMETATGMKRQEWRATAF